MGQDSFWGKLNGSVRRFTKNAAVFAVAGTIIGYWNSFEDKVADRHERAWSVVRTAMQWPKDTSGGNVGQNNAIEILTSDCHGLATVFPFSLVRSAFFQDCVPLRSVALKSMDFRDLSAPGGDFSDSFLACSNFGSANLRGATLRNTRFHAADLKGADLSGANLDNTCFYKANLAGAKLNGIKNWDRSQILQACILKEPGQSERVEIVTDIPDLQNLAKDIPDCGVFLRCGNWDASKWECSE